MRILYSVKYSEVFTLNVLYRFLIIFEIILLYFSEATETASASIFKKTSVMNNLPLRGDFAFQVYVRDSLSKFV